jgi:crotonobetainyl-CoA:carnitine CoA-transferase CaiB-like acyl-CoA transferase
VRRPVPRSASNAAEILAEAGLTTTEIEQLRASGALGT